MAAILGFRQRIWGGSNNYFALGSAVNAAKLETASKEKQQTIKKNKNPTLRMWGPNEQHQASKHSKQTSKQAHRQCPFQYLMHIGVTLHWFCELHVS